MRMPLLLLAHAERFVLLRRGDLAAAAVVAVIHLLQREFFVIFPGSADELRVVLMCLLNDAHCEVLRHALVIISVRVLRL